MSVIVAGVDMPTGCNFSCPCHDGESGFCEAAYTRYGDYKHISEDYDSVPKNCPLKSVDGLIEQIEFFAKRQEEIALAINDEDKRYAHIQVANAYRHCLQVIKEYCEVSEDE